MKDSAGMKKKASSNVLIMKDEEAQQSPLYLALAQSTNLHTFSRILSEENDIIWPFAQKALVDYMGKTAFWEEDDLERLGGLLAQYGDRLLNLEVTTCFFDKCAPAARAFTPFLFDLVAHGRVLMRESKQGEGMDFDVLTPFSKLIRTESHRKDLFCASLIPFMATLVPQVEPFNFGKSEKSLGQAEKAYGEFRANKDQVLLAMAYWRTEFMRAMDPKAKVAPHQFELLRWIACIHLDGVCSTSPAAAVRCLFSFSTALQRFPPALVSLFRDALLHSVDSGSGLLDALFPLAKKDGGFETNSVADDPVRDLVLLSEKAQGDDQAAFQGIIEKMTSVQLPQRQQLFTHSSSGSSFNLPARRFIYDQGSMLPWHRVMVRDLFFRILGKSNNAAKILDTFTSGQTVPLSDLFSNGNENIWCVFVCWWQEHQPFVQTDKRLAKGEPSPVETFFPQIVMDAFKNFGNSVETRAITIDAIPRDHSSLLHLALGVMGLSNSSALCAALSREVDQKYTAMQNFRKISERFLPEDPCNRLLDEIMQGWEKTDENPRTWSMNGLSFVFRESNDVAEGSPSAQLPATLVNSLRWVLFLMKSDFFEFIWSHVEGPANLAKLEETRRVWEDLFVSVEQKTITFPRLEEVIHFLKGEELETFYRSTRSQEFQKGDSLSWDLRAKDESALRSLNEMLNKWRHLQGVTQNLNVIGDCFPHFAQWLVSGSNDKSLVASRKHVSSLCEALEENPWDMQSLAHYDKFAAHCEAIHPCLLQLHPAFFEKIAESTEILDWLRTLPDDQDFTRGIEMAMGRSEMECPPELWLKEEGQPGRVNEQILSMVQSNRSYLHKFIFRESQKFASADDFVNNFLAHLLKFDKSILVQMDRCNQYRQPLMDLLSGGTENSAPGRLLRMLHPSSNAKWVCDSKGLTRTLEDSSSGIASCLCLEYTAHDKSTRTLSVSEIEDFQSSVVLSRTDQKEKETQDAIINFVQSFGWMKAYATHVVALNSFGHFEFGSFSYVAPLQSNAEVIREKALGAEKELGDWEKTVGSVRVNYPALNHFGMKLVWKFVEFLRGRIEHGFSPSDSRSLVQKLVYLVNPVLAEKDHVIAEVENNLLSVWKELACIESNETENDEDGDETMSLHAAYDGAETENVVFKEKEMSLGELLDCCGQTIQSVFGSLPSHSPVAELPDDVIPLSLKRGDLRLILAKGYDAVFHEVFSCFAQCHTFPERRTLLLCRENTTWEEVFLLLLRWRFSAESDKVFAIANADLLSNEIQIKCVAFIQEFRAHQAPLLVICGPNRLAYVATQFANRRMPSFPLPRSLLQELVKKNFSNHFVSYASDSAGAGKSFQIRKKCSELDGGSYVVIPASSLTQFLLLTKQALESERSINTESPSFFDEGGASPNCSLFLHIEVYDTIGMELNSYLFEILFFGGYCDLMSEEIFFYPPSSTNIAIEIPTGPLAKHLSVPSLCPVEKVTSCPEQFAPSKKDMIRGMGLPLFYGNRYDGTALRKREQNVRHANAFDRLQYVCFALNIMKENGGSFPYILETGVEEPEGLLDSLRLSASPGIGDHDDGSMAGSKCFELLVEASHLEGNVSLWCLWNFINMVYWQLRDMHFPSSPLNMICMPTEQNKNPRQKVTQKESNESKMQMKGEILNFILETAREFATRQSNESDPNEVIGVEITGLSRAAFCGKWMKMGFMNCGRPVFRTKDRNSTYYFYYRDASNKWVIDDSIANAGPSYTYTEGSVWGMGVWRSTNQWKMDRDIKVTKIKHAGGHDGEALEVTGFAHGDCNGIYLRQPLYSNINNQPHYAKGLGEGEGERRHIFKDFMWFLCPVCTPDEGVLGTSTDLRRWNIKPPDTVEREVQIREIHQGEWDPESRTIIAPGGSSSSEPAEADENEDEELLAQKSEDFLEFLKLENLFRKTKRWADSNHECLLFSNTNHIVSFLSMNPNEMRDGMHPNLLEFLKNNKVDVGESLDQLSTRHHEVLGALTEVYRTGDDAKNVGGGAYCLTGDNLLKMLAIFIRLRVGIPVILMGECGCGKTSLLNYLCQWLGVNLIILDVHGGTTPLDILQVFEKAKRERDLTKKPQYVFLDEVNACNHMGLICEVITKRTLYGNAIHNDIHILAALNPYRRRPPRGNTFGLVYKQKKGGVAPVIKDDMENLVYRVTPIPVALRDFVFDFGALGPDQEALYVKSMIQSQLRLPSLDNLEHSEAEKQKEKREKDLEVISGLVVESQKYIRKEEGDPSSVSLRDVRRFLFFGNFFLGLKNHTDEWFVSSVVVSLALVYYFRLSSEKSRSAYWENVCCPDVGLNRSNNSSFKIPQEKSNLLKNHIEYFNALLMEAQHFFCSQVELGEGIALNAALTENLFVTIVCILNRVPVFLVGKPGTSKTLTLQIIASNLQGKQSPNPFWRKYPSVYVFPYQCSPMSDSGSIQQQFNMAVRYQEHANNTITVLLLDEVGLAEHSPDMPLKCLHGMLVEPPISIVGLSNWVLDPAKMNRAVLVQRPEPSHSDISQTGSSIMDISSGASETMRLLEKISRAYFRVYTNQKGRDFIGMRDYYSLVKSLRVELRATKNGSISKEQAIFAICRNFSGREDILKDVLFVMCEELYGNPEKKKMEEMTIGQVGVYYKFIRPSLGELVRLNLNSAHESRHLMLLTHNCAALSLVFSCDLVNRNDTKVIIGSEFVEDDTELFLIQQMNEVKLAMATGKTIILMNADNMYEALYDVLNQRYLIKHDQATGKSVRLLRLAIGSRSSLCHVEPGFRIIVIAEKDYAYRELDLPLLNRFEKQILTPSEVINEEGKKATEELNAWIDGILRETDLPSLQSVFCGFHPGTIASLVFSLRQSKTKDLVTEAKKSLKRIASPAAVALSGSLLNVDGVRTHETLSSFVDELFEGDMKKPTAAIATTYSPVTHLHEGGLLKTLNAQVEICRLDQVKSEKSFTELVARHLDSANSSANRLLVVQFDPIMCSSLQINHAKHLATTALSSAPQMKGEKIAILFLVHLPPGLRTRTRHFVLDFEIGWSYAFLDDIRGFTLSSDKRLDIPSLLRMPLSELFEKGVVNFKEIVSFQLPEAMYRLNVLTPPVPTSLPFMESCDAFQDDYHDRTDISRRIHSLKLMFGNCQAFQDFFCDCIMAVLKDKGSLKDEKTGILLHVSLAIGESCGTLMESLCRVVSEMTLQVMINLLYIFEKNFTLGTLKSDSKLWMGFVVNKNVFDFEASSLTFKVGKRAMRELQEKCAVNTGKTQAFVSKFPFSYAVFDLLNGTATREAIEATLEGSTGLKRYEQEIQVMEKTFAAFFGEEVSQIISQKPECYGYFHDFVAMIAPQVDKLSFEEIEFVHYAVLQSFHPRSLSSPAAIHASFRQNERKIRIISSILSVLPDKNRQAVMVAMNEAANIRAHERRTAAVLEAVFHELSKSVWIRASALDFVNGELGKPCSGSSHLPILIASATENVNELLFHYEEEKAKIGDNTTDAPWDEWRSILLLKVFLETYEKEKVQWGMAEKGKMIINLLRDIKPTELDSFSKIFVGLADFFSLIRPCIECTFISHVFDRNHVERDLCLRCANAHELQRRKRVVERKVGGKTSLGHDFWDDFLLTPTQREATLKDTREAGSLASVSSGESKPEVDAGESSKDVEMTDAIMPPRCIVITQASKRQAERVARRFLEVVLVRFFGEVLFAPSLPASKFFDTEKKLISHVNSYLNAISAIIPDVNLAPENLRQFLEFTPSPSTRLSLMHIFLRAERKAGVDEANRFFSPISSTGKLVYLSHCVSAQEELSKDIQLDSLEALGRIATISSQQDRTAVLEWFAKDPEGWGSQRENLESLARVQVALRWYGTLVGSDEFPSENMLGTAELRSFSQVFNTLLAEEKVLQTYVMKSIKEASSLEAVLFFLFSCRKKGCEWVHFDESQLHVVIEESPVGPWLPAKRFKELHNFRGLIIKALASDNEEAFKAVMDHAGLPALLFPALFNEISHQAVLSQGSEEFLTQVLGFVDRVGSALREKGGHGNNLIADLLPLATQIALLLKCGKSKSHLLNRSTVPVATEPGEELSSKAQALAYTLLRLLVGAMANPSSWLADLIMFPMKFSERYLPGSKFESPLDGVTWYECPNGHSYSVGQCGRPMERGKCPTCGAEIGGQNHQSVKGVRQTNKPEDDFVNHLGYQVVVNERVNRLDTACAAFLRLIIDSSLFLSCFIKEDGKTKVSRLVHLRDADKCESHLGSRVRAHFQELCQSHRLDNMLGGVLVKAVFSLCYNPDSLLWSDGAKFNHKNVVFSLENMIKPMIRNSAQDITSDIKFRIDSSNQAQQREEVVEKALGRERWDDLLEKKTEGLTEGETMFTFVPPPTLNHFLLSTDGVDEFEENYPLLSAFLEEEKRLQYVRYIIPVLEWHKLLFSIFQSGEINREEALKISNAQAVARLPEVDRARGTKVMEEFCEAFNVSFPLVGERLFECEENPFLKDGEVNLPGKMGSDTPISFSLPSISDGQKNIDPNTLTTVRLLAVLHRVHEDCLGLGQARRREEEADPANPRTPANNDQFDVGLPEISCDSPVETMRQKLIIYDRGAHFLTLLNTFSYVKGGVLQYDLDAIQDGLRFGVLGGKQSTRLHTKFYVFRGDAKNSGQLSSLKRRVPQKSINDQTMQMILGEVDTQSKVIRLLSSLEVVINFVAKIGGRQGRELGIGKMFVRDYALNTLNMDSDRWEEASTPTIDEHIRLWHLSYLFRRLQVEMDGNPLDDLKPEFRETLEESMVEELRKRMEAEGEKFLGLLRDELYGFILNRLIGEDWATPDMDLKEYLGYQFHDKTGFDWFEENFPDDLFTLQHAHALYMFLLESS